MKTHPTETINAHEKKVPMNNVKPTTEPTTTNLTTGVEDPFEAIALALVGMNWSVPDEAEAFDVGPLPEAFTVEPVEET
jgi:hypothetical protein